ncbi:hypothetical protein PL8927_50198 [Planktothrix serta PCC 8927]|uniref:Uncharacterized protein n=1 Tax=Planktothrix serta PCC 8927 TaxID=671068 RepID=A0A7Z9BRJ8_9CYAN|nr:hypothetical protein PL8927_50198 [Planktothrix serta PCC 8927]
MSFQTLFAPGFGNQTPTIKYYNLFGIAIDYENNLRLRFSSIIVSIDFQFICEASN